MGRQVIPEDFPKNDWLGAVSGAQPKLLVRQNGERYEGASTEEARLERYDICEDLAQQLAPYTRLKMSENCWSLEEALPRLEASVAKKVHNCQWDFSAAEVTWIMKRTREVLLVPVPQSPSQS
ncbi:hypothetical protein [Cupriavidus metallidurans]|uniref:hypothetical protein n=1 Tax=Cupriavidus metallidurans TaxID=119219 RepID=UPI001CCC6652|nr:hypothetical protein [Cupriavidus metallidurans]UBM09988.1 hypothetical protein LAI70_22195 [Cupriavidus metallidurans]